VETKPSAASLTSLIEQLNGCLSRGTHDETGPAGCRQQEHGKYAGLVALRPRFLWLVAPDARKAYEVSSPSLPLAIEAVPFLPRADLPGIPGV